jgi:serine phosphatase RsbU (regulator of sigma subunit)
MPEKPFEAYSGNEPYVFVSYAHADSDLVYPEIKWLRDAGYRIWYDQGIPPSENWVGVIPNRISTCTVFLLFLSSAATASKWVRKEISYAHRLPRELPILPVYLSDTNIDPELDFQLGDTHALLLHRMDLAELRKRLHEQLRKHPGLCSTDDEPGELERAEAKLVSATYRAMFSRLSDPPTGYSRAVWFRPARTIGGDLYDFRVLPDGRWLVITGDVAGKGVPAAFLAVALSGMIDGALAVGASLPAAISSVNSAFAQRAEDRFATLLALTIDPIEHRLSLVNAGHMFPMLLRATGKPREFTSDMVGLPLGVMPEFTYSAVETQLEPGDYLLQVTDGVTDALSPSGELFGITGLESFQKTVLGTIASSEWLVDRLRDAITAHSAGRAQHDDITIVCLGRNAT